VGIVAVRIVTVNSVEFQRIRPTVSSVGQVSFGDPGISEG
jgi:hypothetical protein